MEAPVPASALIHSSTLVSSGIYLLFRLHLLFFYCQKILILLFIFGCFSMIYGSFIAFFQSDLKKILAFSTISHCGILIIFFFFKEENFLIFYL